MPNMELLKKKGEYMNRNDMMEVFRIGKTTLWKLEKEGKDGFPPSVIIGTQKVWITKMVVDYIEARNHAAANHLKEMVKLRFACQLAGVL